MAKGLVAITLLTSPLAFPATVEVRRQGCSVNGLQSGIAPFSVTTTGIGALVAGDTVCLDNGDRQFHVVSASGNTVVITGTGTQKFNDKLTLANGTRLTPINALPTLFSDSDGKYEIANPALLLPNVPYEVFVATGTYDTIERNGSGTTMYKDVAVVAPSADIADGSITNAMIADGTIQAGKLADTYLTAATAFYQTVKNPAGAAQTQRGVVKFTGATVSVSDVGGETVVDVAASTPAQGDITAVSQVVESDVSSNHTLTDDNAEHVRVTTNFTVAATCVGLLIQYQANYEVDTPDGSYLKLHLYVGGAKKATCLLGPGNSDAGFSVFTANIAWIEAAPSAGSLAIEVREQKSAAGVVWTDLANAYQGARLMITELKK